jgi:hypothetical protein
VWAGVREGRRGCGALLHRLAPAHKPRAREGPAALRDCASLVRSITALLFVRQARPRSTSARSSRRRP